MKITQQLAEHLRQVHFGGNWSWSNVKDVLQNVTQSQAVAKGENSNSIAALVFHMNYYVRVLIDVMEGRTPEAHDKFSWETPDFPNEEQWQKMISQSLSDAEQLAILISTLPDAKLQEVFIKEKYGNYLRNILGVIEHVHYHLGQIVILKRSI